MQTLLRPSAVTVLCLALAGAGCELIRGSQELTGPGGTTGTQAFSGTWASAAAGSTIQPNQCGDLRWQITEITATSASGTFSATCAGAVRIEGTASGTLSGTTLNWNANGTATPPGCPFTLTGSAVPEATDAIRVHYSGTVCGVAVSGSEVLRRR